MKVVMTGSSGLIGSALAAALRSDAHEVMRLVRRAPTQPDEAEWRPDTGEMDPGLVDGSDAVIHLSGESLAAARWTEDKKRALRESRVKSTRLLANAIRAATNRPPVWLCASAVGIYGNRGDEVLTEESPPGTGFLAELCRDWEAETKPAAEAGTRVVNTRFGVVLAREGGALEKVLPLFRMGTGGRIGKGTQYMSWVHMQDLVAACRFLLNEADITGPVNVTAPNPVTNDHFTKAMGKAVNRPTAVPVPGFALRFALGELADETLLASQRVMPERLRQNGFTFQFATIEDALQNLVARD